MSTARVLECRFKKKRLHVDTWKQSSIGNWKKILKELTGRMELNKILRVKASKTLQRQVQLLFRLAFLQLWPLFSRLFLRRLHRSRNLLRRMLLARQDCSRPHLPGIPDTYFRWCHSWCMCAQHTHSSHHGTIWNKKDKTIITIVINLFTKLLPIAGGSHGNAGSFTLVPWHALAHVSHSAIDCNQVFQRNDFLLWVDCFVLDLLV